MSQAISPVNGRPYGLAMVCRVWRIARSGVYRVRAPSSSAPLRRRGPVGPMPDTALLAAIRTELADSPFPGEGHRKVWARLRYRGIRTSLRRVLRLMRENALLAPPVPARRVGHDRTTAPSFPTRWTPCGAPT